MNKLNFYTIAPDYINYITPFDQKISMTYDNKAKRPYIGIVFKVYDVNYFAPFTSPKPKHLKMHNNVDFLKIDNGKLGAINFNNMIPVPLNECIKIDVLHELEEKYKNLLLSQINWCNKKTNNKLILIKAKCLYNTVTTGKCNTNLFERCCNFKLLEQKCIEYIKIKA